MRALILASDGFEDLELFYPKYRLEEEGVEVKIATPDRESIEGMHGYEASADYRLRGVDSSEFDLLLLPGGRSPEALRMEGDKSIEVVRAFDASGKPIGAICHGAQLLISADAVDGSSATCYPSIMDDLDNAGATVRDEPVVVDGNLVTSRSPDDLPQFMEALVKKLERRKN